MKIYTRTGDRGTTSLYTGQRVQKNEPIIHAIGCVDESNSTLGLAVSLFPDNHKLLKTKDQLTQIQMTLFDVGAALATPMTTADQKKLEKTRFDESAVEALEMWIDEMEAQLTPLQHFILPGGHPAGAALHLARSTVRHAERAIISTYKEGNINANVLIYLNRLSDYLFVAARFVNHLLNNKETQWLK